MTSNYENQISKQFEELMERHDNLLHKLEQERKEHKKEKKRLNEKIKFLENKVENLENENKKLKKEVSRLKTQTNKDSSNSNKPSSTNGFKNVIINRREPSNKSKGGQKGHKGKNLGQEKLKEILENPKVIINPTVEINKNENNKNKKPHKCTEIDIDIILTVTDYIYYPDKDGFIRIPKKHKKHICYGDNIKSLSIDLMYEAYNSTDSVQRILSSLTDNTITISKGTLINWSKEISEKLQPEIEKIEKELLNSYYAGCDESQIKVNGKFYNELCVCNEKYTRMWTKESKKHKELEKIDFFKNFMGVIIKDGTDLYNGFGIAFSQCLSHIQRYLKGIYDNVEHESPKLMSNFLTKCNELRDKLKEKGIKKFKEKEYKNLLKEYDEILYKWKREWMKDEDNPVYEEERKLLIRFEEDDKEEILYFLKDFKVPSTNNQAETDQRNIKIKQKIRKIQEQRRSRNLCNH